MNVVLYLRYSSYAQNEQSIEGQERICTQFCERNGYNIIHKYIDRALSASKDTDKRTQFLKMIKDSENGLWDAVIVYKLDRFARDRYDSAIYKNRLKKQGVKVISATEAISDTPEGIILESVLEGMAEFYSKELSQKVSRGIYESVSKGQTVGGYCPLGYTIVDKHLQINEATAPIVKEAFELYANGYTIKELCSRFNGKGYRTTRGRSFNRSSFDKMFRNKRYIGVIDYKDIHLEDAVPRIIDQATWNKVQEKLHANRKAPSRSKAKIMYLLSGKCFCGHCGTSMVGESGTSKTGATHSYYKCSNQKRGHLCDKKPIRKDVLEQAVVEDIMKILTPEYIDKIADLAVEASEKEYESNTVISSIEAEVHDIERAISNLFKFVERGSTSESLFNRLEELEKQKSDLLHRLTVEQNQTVVLEKDHVIWFLMSFVHGDVNDEEFRRRLIDTLVNSVTVYDLPDGGHRITETFNIAPNNMETYKGSIIEKSSDMNFYGASLRGNPNPRVYKHCLIVEKTIR